MMKEWVKAYVKGCGVCQQNKTNTHPMRPPLHPITPKANATPFSTITMDWITKLPPSFRFDPILTIMDHDCLKAVLLFPCKETMGTEELAKLYFNKVFPHYGIPKKIISDQVLWTNPLEFQTTNFTYPCTLRHYTLLRRAMSLEYLRRDIP
jgi:hypothetical protein